MAVDRRVVFGFVALAVLGSSPRPAGAAPPAPGSGPEYDVYVTGDERVVEEVATQRVIDAERIQERSARTLDEALQLEPGVYVRTGSDATPRIDVRGLRSRHVLLLLDGIPFNSTEDGQFDPAWIPTEFIDRIKVQYGTNSTLYGDGPLAGVVQIETQEGEEGVHGSLGGEARESDQYLGRFTFSGAQDRTDWFVAGSSVGGHGFPLSSDFEPTPFEDGGQRENSARERGNLFAKLGYRPSDATRIGLLVTGFDGEFGLPPSTIDGGDFAQRVRYERVEDADGLSGQVSMQFSDGGPLELRSWLYANRLEEDRRRYDDDRYDSMDDPTVSGTFRQDSDALVYGGAFHGALALGRAGRLRLALQSRNEDFDADGIVRDVRLGGGQFGVRSFDSSDDLEVYSGALEWELHPVRSTGLVLGYGHSWLTKDTGSNASGPQALLGVYWDVVPDLRLRASAAKKIRFPSIRQLYDVDGGNPDLDPEESWNFEVGLTERLPGDVVLDVAAYLVDVRDFIERIPPDDTFLNNDHYRFRGIDVSLSAQPWDALDANLFASFLDSENESSNAAQDELQYRPRVRYGGELVYQLPLGFAARVAVSRVRDQVFFSRTVPQTRRELRDYTLVDLKLSKAVLDERFDLYVGVNNVGDEDYAQSYALPQAGRTFFGGVEGRF